MELTRSAQILRKELKKDGIDVSHTRLLDMMARATGHKDYESTKQKNYEAVFSVGLEFKTCSENWPFVIKASNESEAIEITQNLLDTCSVYLVGNDEDGGLADIQNPPWIIGISDVDYTKRSISIDEVYEFDE